MNSRKYWLHFGLWFVVVDIVVAVFLWTTLNVDHVPSFLHQLSNILTTVFWLPGLIIILGYGQIVIAVLVNLSLYFIIGTFFGFLYSLKKGTGSQSREVETIPVYKVNGEINAAIIKDFLKTNGVPAYFGSIGGGKNGISAGVMQMIYVDKSKKEEALRLIGEAGFPLN